MLLSFIDLIRVQVLVEIDEKDDAIKQIKAIRNC